MELNNDVATIESLPYEILKGIFPSVRYYVSGQKWHLMGLSKKKLENGKTETKAYGRYEEEFHGKGFSNPQSAWEYAHTHYSKGKFRIRAYVPELHEAEPNLAVQRSEKSVLRRTNVIMSDR